MKRVFAAAAFVGVIVFASIAQAAPVIGFAVEGLFSPGAGDNPVGNTLQDRTAQGLGGLNNGLAIEYFIPLGNASGIYGAGNTNGNNGFGQVSDTGNGGGTLSMFLRFNVANTGPHELSILFEDLDLVGANDPPGFLENVNVFDENGNSLTGLIDDITSILVTGDANTIQTAVIALPSVTSPLFLQLDFISSLANGKGRNTPEYLIAAVTPVPIPAALPLFAGALGLFGLFGWRRKRARCA